MPRRSRHKGGRKHQTQHPPKLPSRAEVELEEALDQLGVALSNGDIVRSQELLASFEGREGPLAEVIARRLIEDREPEIERMMTILLIAAEEDAPAVMERVARSRRAPDWTRFLAQRHVGFDDRRETQRRAGFLRSLRDPEALLVHIAEGAGVAWPARSMTLPEGVAYLEALPIHRRQPVLERILRETGHNAIPLLHVLLHVPEPAVQTFAIEALAGLRFPGSLGPLRRLAATAQDEAIRAGAEEALRATTFDQLPPAGEDDLPVYPNRGLPDLHQVLMSPIGVGTTYSIWVIHHLGGELYVSSVFLCDDLRGVSEPYQYGPTSLEEIEMDIDDMEGDTPLVDIDLAAARGALEIATEMGAAENVPFDPVFELWEPFVHDTWPPAADEPVTRPLLDDAPYAGRDDLLAESSTLVEHETFSNWFLDIGRLPYQQAGIEPDADEAWTDAQYAVLAQAALDEPGTIDYLRRGLRMQAWLLDRTGDGAARDQALAAAASLASEDANELARNPFMRALADVSPDRSAVFAGLGWDLLGDLDDDDWDGEDDDEEDDLDEDGIELDGFEPLFDIEPEAERR